MDVAPGERVQMSVAGFDRYELLKGRHARRNAGKEDPRKPAAKGFVLVSATAPGRRHYPLLDALGSTRALTNENGEISKRYTYDPYGRDAGTTGTGPNTRIRFAGGERDAQGHYHYGARFYDPNLGRWTQRDPLNQPADLRQANRYMYAGGDPINITDPTGFNHNDEAAANRRGG